MAAALQTNTRLNPINVVPGRSLTNPSRAPCRVRCAAASPGKKRFNIALLPGDGIGPEVISVAKNVLQQAGSLEGLEFNFQEMPVGGAALDLVGVPLPEESFAAAKQSDAILLGAIGGYKWDNNEKHLRPEMALFYLRRDLKVFANLRPATVLPQLVDASTLKREVAEGVDMMIVRELTGGIYFGEPRGIKTDENGEEVGFNTEFYAAHEIDRIARVAFETARKRRGKLIGMLPSASLGVSGPGLFEPIHGSAPDIAGQDKANPLATILSAAMLLKYGLGEEKAAKRIEDAVLDTLNKGFRTGDIYSPGNKLVGCKEMGEEVLKSVDSKVTATV
ncbi:hypothetical protein HID58_004343 [Brassica napus]|uniref:Isopropylmalate dehydrogenase-like domain-containing protein n=1 Tax=Brassica napus TaxID=3708 RepID=A0ABQ8E5H4_BRANA|nr:hypothetical protein HID58_004343 [Brassica napus]